MSENLNIYQKLAKIRKPVEIMRKESSGYGYNYVDEESILAQITGSMAKYKVSLIPSIVPGTLQVIPYQYTKMKKGEELKVYEILTQADMLFKWVNNDNPDDCVEVPWSMTGQQADASQAFGSGLTYATRYFLLKYFNVATTDDDPDNWRSRQKEAENQEDALLARTIIDKVHKQVNEFVATNEDAKPEITKIIKKYTKKDSGNPSPNYFAIKKPDVAAELAEEINKFVKAAENKAAKKGTKGE